MRIISRIAALFLVLSATEPCWAESPVPSSAGEARARACFLRGVDLYEERDFNGAGTEFRRAYEFARNFRILFNLGRVAVELHDYASAIDLFSRYLSDGVGQMAPDRTREVQDEIARLRPRVGKIELLVDQPAEVYLDDVSVGWTPLPPLTVNVGRRRLMIRPQRGEPEMRTVDVPGGETVTVRIAPFAAGSLPAAAPTSQPSSAAADLKHIGTGQVEGKRRSSTGLWLGWTATAACAVGAAVLGVWAYRASQDLDHLRQSYPVTRDELDRQQRKTRILGGVADGLAAAAIVVGGASLYFTLDGPARPESARAQVSVGLSWPNLVNIGGQF